jgi:hypothetical protein
MAIYVVLKITKFLALLAYAGGLCAALSAVGPKQHQFFVHRVASPALLVTWLAGYGLSLMTSVPLSELWIAGGLLLSLVSQLALVFSAAKGRRDGVTFAWATVPLVGVVVLMVTRPTWQGIFG